MAALETRPFLVTERLELWMPQASDLWPIFEIITHPETRRFLGPESTRAEHFARFSRNAGGWLLYGYGMLMLRERGGNGSLIGNCGVFHSVRGLGEDFDDRPEGGWILAHNVAGKGYASEAMQAVLDWFDGAFAKEIMCMIVEGNAASLRVADRLGFTELRRATLPDGDAVHLLRRPPSG